MNEFSRTNSQERTTIPDEQKEMILGIRIAFDGRYTVLRPLGDGGMSSVFLVRAEDGFSPERAIKVINKSELQGRVDYYAEMDALRSLRDVDGATDLIETEEDAKYLYIVQEYVEGKSLRDIREQGMQLSENALRTLMTDLAGTLSIMETRGVLHRDIKPDNIMITRNGRAKLIDFGASAFLDVPADRKDNIPIGTRAYMAPERFEGVPANAQTEIYAYGATFYSLITFKPPLWTDEDARRRIRIMQEEIREQASSGIAEVICKCIEYRPKLRFRSFAQVYRNLGLLDAYEDALKAGKRRRRKANITAAALVLAGIMLTGLGVVRMNADHNNIYSNAITRARHAYYDGRIEDAKSEYEDAMQIDPDRPEAYNGYFEILTDETTGMTDDSARDNSYSYDDLIQEIQNQSEKTEALQENAETLTLLGNAYMNAKEYDEAENVLKRALRNSSRDTDAEEATLLLGMTYALEKEYDEAENIIDTLESGSREDEADYLRGWIREREMEYDDAVEYYTSVRNNSDDIELKRNAASEIANIDLKTTKNAVAAVSSLEESLEDPDLSRDYQLNYMLMDAYFASKDYNDAAEQGEQLLEQSPKNANIYQTLTSAYLYMNQYEAALETTDHWIGNCPQDSTPYVARAQIYGTKLASEQEGGGNPGIDSYEAFCDAYEQAERKLAGQYNTAMDEMEASYQNAKEALE